MATNKNAVTPETMLMSGVNVDFPYPPYPCQIAMLGKIIKALQQSKNCLLESPTGTGKTLTLLCATLAWQQKEIEQSRQSSTDENKDENNESSSKSNSISPIFYCTRTHKQLEQVAKQLNNTVYKDKIRMTLLSSRDNYCIHPTVSKGPNKSSECIKLTRPDPNNYQRGKRETSSGACGFYERLRGKTANDFLRFTGAKPIPRVFDIEQFAEYCQSNHAICPYYTSRLLIQDVNIILCPYNYLIDPRVRNSMQLSVSNAVIIIDEAHNIEDCARDSMKFELRKYDFQATIDEFNVNEKILEMGQIQAAHLLVNKSGFSWTQEPSSSAQLTLSQQKLARFAAGYSELDQFEAETDLLEHLNIDQHGNDAGQSNDVVQSEVSDVEELANALKFLTDRFARLITWFDSKDPRDTHTFTLKELLQQFHQAKFIDRSIVNIQKSTTNGNKRGINQDVSRIRKALNKCFLLGSDYLKLSDEVSKFIETFDLCLSIIYADDYQFIDDYKITLKTIPFEPSASVLSQMQSSTESNQPEWINMSQNSSQFRRSYHPARSDYPLHTQQLTFYCLSPSVAFSRDLTLARSLIFASGTLAPLATYAGELRIPFDFQMECNHVIDVHRTFITTLSHGRNSNVKLRATYQHVDKIEFQDQCGLVVLDVCQRVPYGVLCFVPSYRFLNLIMNRWMSSGLWQQLNQQKSVFFEEKNGANFQNTINRFREANGTFEIAKPISATAKRVNSMWRRAAKVEKSKTTTNSSYFPIKGGLLLAVCRGRASEGIDFSDNNARCVITLGIPYPNLKEDEVIFKRDFNDAQNRRLPQVMNGSDWYDAQAYRALNQALGRCIRHKNDWGALIIVDERIANAIQEKQFGNKISLWIKQRLFLTTKYDETMNALEKFAQDMKKSDEQVKNTQEEVIPMETNISQCEQVQTSLISSPLTESNSKSKQTESTPRQWKILDSSDDEHDQMANENRNDSKKTHAFERFLAQRSTSISTPPHAAPQQEKRIKDKVNASQTQQLIDLTSDDDDFVPSTPSLTRQSAKKFKSR